MEYLPILIVAIGGTLGMISHIVKKKVKGETASDIIAYFKGHTKSTLLAFGTMVGAVALIYDPSIGIVKLFAMSMTAGYTSDSALNKDGGK